MAFVRETDEEDENGKESDEVRLTESGRINWRPLNEYTPLTMILGQEKLTRPPGIQDKITNHAVTNRVKNFMAFVMSDAEGVEDAIKARFEFKRPCIDVDMEYIRI